MDAFISHINLFRKGFASQRLDDRQAQVQWGQFLPPVLSNIEITPFSPVMIQMKTTSMDIEVERSSAEVKRPQ